jgi:hypothetical protein
MLSSIGVWISPDGQVFDVYGAKSAECTTHQGWALAHGMTTEEMLEDCWISVSQGEYFRFQGQEEPLRRIRDFVRKRLPIYRGAKVSLDDDVHEREVMVADLLDQ